MEVEFSLFGPPGDLRRPVVDRPVFWNLIDNSGLQQSEQPINESHQ